MCLYMYNNIKYVLVNCFVNLYIVLLPNGFKEVYKNIENKNRRENRKGNRTGTPGRARPESNVHKHYTIFVHLLIPG